MSVALANARRQLELFKQSQDAGSDDDEVVSPAPVNIRQLKALSGNQAFFPAGQSLDSLASLPMLPPAPRQDGTLPDLPALVPLGQQQRLALDSLPGVEEGHVHQAFKEIDFDGNGFIGVNELRYLLVVLGERPKDEELDEMLRMLDTDGDGQVSYEEFCTLFTKGHPVLVEMAAMAPEEETRTESQAEISRPGSPTAGSPSPRDMSLLLKGAAGFLHFGNEKKRLERHMKAMPKAKAKVEGASRARPQDSRKPMPVSPRQARRDRQNEISSQNKAKGASRGEPVSPTSPQPAANLLKPPVPPQPGQPPLPQFGK